jgi:hypothetical protein
MREYYNNESVAWEEFRGHGVAHGNIRHLLKSSLQNDPGLAAANVHIL